MAQNEVILVSSLLGAHSLGGCKTENTGFHGVWDFSDTKLDNGYYRSLAGSIWLAQSTPNGQYVHKTPTFNADSSH